MRSLAQDLRTDTVPGGLWAGAEIGTEPFPVWAQVAVVGIQVGAGWGEQCPADSMEAIMDKGSGQGAMVLN